MLTSNITIREWPQDDRPREKLFKQGEQALSTAELLAILLRTGSRGQSALDLSRTILSKFKTLRNMSDTDLRAWDEFKGLGAAKIAQIKAALEIGRRFNEERIREDRKQIKSSGDVIELIMPQMRDLKREVFKVIFLNAQNRIIASEEMAKGTVNHASPIIREIFQRALQNFAVSLICAHNHPSGAVTPSPEDHTFTRKLHEAGKVMQIKILDHIIIGNDQYYSFADQGQL